MPSSDISLHRALVVRSSSDHVFVKIPTLLGPNESIELYKPQNTAANWPPAEGAQLIVCVEGANFNRVYMLHSIDGSAS
jgi:hypothetical protein